MTTQTAAVDAAVSVTVTPADLTLPAELLVAARTVGDAMRFDELLAVDPGRWAAVLTEELAEVRGCDLEIRYCGCPIAHPLLHRLLSRPALWGRLPGRWQAWVAGDPCWLAADLAAQAKARGCDFATRVCACDEAHPRLIDLAERLRLWDRLPRWATTWLVGDPCWYVDARVAEARERGCDPDSEACVCPAEHQRLFMLAVRMRLLGRLPRLVRRWVYGRCWLEVVRQP